MDYCQLQYHKSWDVRLRGSWGAVKGHVPSSICAGAQANPLLSFGHLLPSRPKWHLKLSHSCAAGSKPQKSP